MRATLVPSPATQLTLANIPPKSSQLSQARKGRKKGMARQQGVVAIAASSASAGMPAAITQVAIVREDSSPAVNSQAGGVPRAQDLAADLALRSSVAAPSAAPAQAHAGLVVPEAGSESHAMSTPFPAQDAALTAGVATPTGPNKLASTWWGSHVKHLQRLAGLGKKQVTGTAVLEAVPNVPAYHWPADPTLRQIGSGGQGTVYYAEKWLVDSTSGRVKKRAAALKALPCATQQQAALLDREATNLRALQGQSKEGHQVTAPYAPALLDVFQHTATGRGFLAMSLVEGQLLDEFMSTALEKQTPRQFVETVAQVLQKLLQVLEDLYSRNGRSFGDLKPENILMAGGKQLVLIDWCSSRDASQEAVEGAPSTLGYPSPEVTALGHSHQPSAPLDLHKDDVWAVGVMGLLWLSKGQDMPFGPTRHQAERLASPQGMAETREGVMAQHSSWAKAHPGSADMTWPAKQSKLLEKVKDPAVREQAGVFFLAILHPDAVQRVTASQALKLAFVR
ncbi:serine threonine protein kinase [Trebouxia sp. C0010 RCD-2024]